MEKLMNLIVVCVLLLSANPGMAQEDKSQRKSPPATVEGKVGSTDITIAYSQPAVSGREIWGGLVPYGEIWRTGANEATTFSTSGAVIVEGQLLELGTYSLFTIPGEEEWTVIFNHVPDQWGAYKYDQQEDALRVKVKPTTKEEMTERLKFEIEEVNDHNSVVYLKWENLVLPIKFREKVF